MSKGSTLIPNSFIDSGLMAELDEREMRLVMHILMIMNGDLDAPVVLSGDEIRAVVGEITNHKLRHIKRKLVLRTVFQPFTSEAPDCFRLGPFLRANYDSRYEPEFVSEEDLID